MGKVKLQSMMKNRKNSIIIILLIVFIVAVGAFQLLKNKNNSEVNRLQKENLNAVDSENIEEGLITEEHDGIPNDFPENFPLYPNAKVDSAFSTVGDEVKAQSIVLITSDQLGKVEDFYKRELVNNNWKFEITEDDRDTTIFSFNRNEVEGFMAIGGTKDATVISITVGAEYNQPSM